MMASRRRRGFSMLEVVIAASLTLMVLTASGIALANTQKSVTTGQTRDMATTFALNVLERAAALNCGMAVDPNSDRIILENARCSRALLGPDTETDLPYAPDASFTTTDLNGRTFDVTATSRWVQVGAEDLCRSTDVNAVGRLQLTKPGVLERIVTLSWTVAGVQQQETYTSTQAAPSTSDFTAAGLGGVLVYAPAGTQVTLSSSGAGVPITRTTTTCGGSSNGDAAAWFPYLPAGQYLVGRAGSSLLPVDVAYGQVQEVIA